MGKIIINVVCHINRLKEKNYIFINTEKEFDKVTHNLKKNY